LLSKFFVTADGDKPDHVLVRYEELTSSPKVAVKLARNKIKKSHLFVLEVLACQVAKNKLTDEPFPVINDLSSQRSNTDAVNDLTSFSDGLDDSDNTFDNEDGSIVLIDWQELPLDDVRMQMTDPASGVRVGARSWRLKTYHDVFVGNEAVDWLVERYPLSRDGAVLLCRELQDQGWLRHVKNDHQFKDDHLFFVWLDPTSNGVPVKGKGDIEMKPMSTPKLPVVGTGDASAKPPSVSAAAGEVRSPPSAEPKKPQSKWEEIQSTVSAWSMEQKAACGCGLVGLISFLMGWNFVFLLAALAGSYFAWRSGQNSVDEELRQVNSELRSLKDKLAAAGAIPASPTVQLVGSSIEPDRNVELLMARHRETIDKIRAELGEEINDKDHDDLFILRYVLSFKAVEPACDAIRKCLAWRSENRHILDLVDRNEQVPSRAMIASYAISDYHPKPMADGGPLLVTRAGLCDLSSLLSHVSMKDLVEWLMWLNEWGYRECDRVTRETGRLTKLVRVNDLNHASILQDRGFFSAIGKASKVASYCYPQLVDKNVILNAPSLISIVLKVAAQFVSANTMSKVALCRGKTTHGDFESCPFATRRFQKGDLPEFMGGNCGSDEQADAPKGCQTGRCIQGAKNSATDRSELD